jgi:S-formylglutathione hydrolase FrmB
MLVHVLEVDSAALGGPAPVRVVLPGAPPPPGGFPVLYLVHGLDDDGRAWLLRTAVVRLAAERGIALVVPRIGESFATDEAHGLRYWTFLSSEVPPAVEGAFPVSALRERTAVVGVSMGGYAAVKWALRHPERFRAAASLSGSLDIADAGRYERRPRLMHQIFGGRPVPGTPDDLFWLLGRLDASRDPRPALYIACGEQDSHVAENRRFIAAAGEVRGLALTTRFGSGGHDWPYWTGLLPDVLDWTGL